MNKVAFALPLILMTAAAVQCAPVTVLTFEGLQDQQPVGNYFSGISFGPGAVALQSVDSGGSGNFTSAPSGNTALWFYGTPSTANDVMNVTGGFTSGLSFWYSAAFAPTTVDIYSGANGTGTLLAALALPQTSTGTCSDAFCPFVSIGTAFSGTAYSVDFSGSANEAFFDDITLGSQYAVPEPATFALIALAGGIALLKRRK